MSVSKDQDSVICLDSDSDDFMCSPTKQRRRNGKVQRQRKKTSRTAKNRTSTQQRTTRTLRNTKSRERVSTPDTIDLNSVDDVNDFAPSLPEVVSRSRQLASTSNTLDMSIECIDDSYEVPPTQSSVASELAHTDLQSNESNQGKENLSTNLLPDNDSQSHESVPSPAEVTKPKVTARRGLAKKRAKVTDTDTASKVPSVSKLSHNISVYSERVAHGFKSIFQKSSIVDDQGHADKATDEPQTKTEDDAKTVKEDSTESAVVAQRFESIEDESGYEGVEETLEASLVIRSPTPPPKASVGRRAKRMNKELSSALKTLSQAQGSLGRPVTPAKSRRSRNSDVIFVEETFDVKTDIVVKVRYLSSVHRINMKVTEPFHGLISKVSKKIGEEEYNLALYLHDQSLDVTATPKSSKLTVADIIECHFIRTDADEVNGMDSINLVIQCRDKKTKTTLTANKRRPLSDVIQKYAEKMGIDSSCLTFSFDGENVQPGDTPSKLDMEDDDVIDVVVDSN